MNIQYFKYAKSTYANSIIMSITSSDDEIEVDMSEWVYEITPEGKVNYSNKLMKDVSDYDLGTMVNGVKELMEYRQRTFDSSDLIKALFEKLPDDVRSELLKELNVEYHL